MVFHCYSFNTVLGFIYLSLFYVGKSWQIILGAGIGELSCMVPWLVSPAFYFLSAPSSPHACLPIQSTHLSDGSDKLGEHTQRHYGS